MSRPRRFDEGRERERSPKQEQSESDSSSSTSDHEDADDEHNPLWPCFQTTAVAITELYKASVTAPRPLHPCTFQSAATSATALYRGCLDYTRSAKQHAYKRGQAKRLRDIIKWVKKHRQLIHRDELLSHLYTLSGHPPSPRRLRGLAGADTARSPADSGNVVDLEPFHDALVTVQPASVGHLSSSAGRHGGNTTTGEIDFQQHVLDHISQFCSRKRRRGHDFDAMESSPDIKRARRF